MHSKKDCEYPLDERGDGNMYDVIIIGAGVTGCAIARELSKYELKIAVLDKEEDVCCQTSKANSGIVHAGFDAKPGSLKAQMNIRGSQMMEELSVKLDFPYKRNGSLVLCFDESGREKLQKLLMQGRENKVEGLVILEKEQLLSMEPGLSDEVVCALYAPSGAIVCPFGLTIALAENAAANGAEFFFNTEVLDIQRMQAAQRGYLVRTSKGDMKGLSIVNAAGVYADIFHNMVSRDKIHIIPRKGEYCLYDHRAGDMVKHTIFQLPTAMGKGVLVTPTVHGNLLTGPTACDISDKEDTSTTAEGLNFMLQSAARSVRELPTRQIITSFSGLRAHEDGDDFIIGEVWDAPGFFDAAGIESPGLTSAPAIGERLSELVTAYLRGLSTNAPVRRKSSLIDTRKGIPQISLASPEELRRLVAEYPAYGAVVCRCETVTEGELIDAIRRPLGAHSLDGIKRRTRAGMGRCQAGFCSVRVMEILHRELGIHMEEITKSGGGSRMLTGGRE